MRDRSAIDQAIAQGGGLASINLAGRLSLVEFFALVARSDVVITGDSLPMHVASAFDRPLVSLFGPTNEDLVGRETDRPELSVPIWTASVVIEGEDAIARVLVPLPSMRCIRQFRACSSQHA